VVEAEGGEPVERRRGDIDRKQTPTSSTTTAVAATGAAGALVATAAAAQLAEAQGTEEAAAEAEAETQVTEAAVAADAAADAAAEAAADAEAQVTEAAEADTEAEAAAEAMVDVRSARADELRWLPPPPLPPLSVLSGYASRAGGLFPAMTPTEMMYNDARVRRWDELMASLHGWKRQATGVLTAGGGSVLREVVGLASNGPLPPRRRRLSPPTVVNVLVHFPSSSELHRRGGGGLPSLSVSRVLPFLST
jgi:hypothetical protein